MALIQFIRATLDEAGLTSTPIVAGVGGLSTRETIDLAKAAAKAGAYVLFIHIFYRVYTDFRLLLNSDAGMVILPAYYAASLNTDSQQVVQYYIEICEASPVSNPFSRRFWCQPPLTMYTAKRYLCCCTTSQPMQAVRTCHLL
jgi:4-hydroxy-2-oxoglutarate aldolase